MKLKSLSILSLITASLILAACGPAKTTTNTKGTPTPASTDLKLSAAEIPNISLTPREDGHELTLKIDNISPKASSMEYELLYSAADNGLEIEKGLGDTIKTHRRCQSGTKVTIGYCFMYQRL